MKVSFNRLVSGLLLAVGLAYAYGICAQSPDQNYPTPVTTTEIRATIRARDIGDSRVTTHFYAFDGSQGDIFINVQAKNFDGDIDVFIADGLRLLTKIVLYSDAGVTETGRIVYMRKGERLLLRVEGRSPDDSPAAYSIKFAGSFIALESDKRSLSSGVPKVTNDDANGVRLNSIGSVLEAPVVKKPPVAVTTTAKKAELKTERPSLKKPPAAATSRSTPAADVTGPTVVKVAKPKPPTKLEAAAVDPLASIRLSIELKNGQLFERRMSEVLRLSTDKGVITVIGKDGKIVRYPITDVLKVTIQ